MLLHLPIGLILLALVLEIGRWPVLRRVLPMAPRPVIHFVAGCGALTALITAVLGWMLSYSGGYDPKTLKLHMIAGLATAIGALLTYALLLLADSRPGNPLVRVGGPLSLMLTAAIMGAAGHLGATITHGDTYLTEFAPNSIRRVLGLPLYQDPAKVLPRTFAEKTAFTDFVQPVLANRCAACHGPTKAKAGLRLDRLDGILKGGESGPAIVAGDLARSELIKRLTLPADDEEHMPPPGKPQPSEDELAILKWWVQAGAADGKLGDLKLPEDVRVVLDRQIPDSEKEALEARRRQQAQQMDESLASLRKTVPGSLRLIVPGQTDLEFTVGNRAGEFGDPQLQQLTPIAASLRWVDLRRARVTGSGLKVLSQMSNVARLELQETATDDDALGAIAKLSGLEVLNLYGTKITDTGLAHLASLKKLRKLYVWRTGVTEAGEKQLRQVLPDVEVERQEPTPRISPAPGSPKTPGERLAFADIAGAILADRCIGCHGAEKPKAGLQLDSLEHVLKGGKNGPVVVAGKPAESLMIKRLLEPADSKHHMPPKSKPQPADDEIAILKWWVQTGAPDAKKLAELAAPPDIQKAIEKHFGKDKAS